MNFHVETCKDGFNLTDSAIADLERLIEDYRRICEMRDDIEQMWHVLNRNSETAVVKGFADPTILKPNLPALQEILGKVCTTAAEMTAGA